MNTLETGEPVPFYAINRLTRCKKISQDQANRLAHLAKAGDTQARSDLICGNIGLAIKILKDIQGHKKSFDDRFVGAAFTGLCIGVDLYDPERGFRISTMLGRCIRNEIIQASRHEGYLIRVPDYMHTVLRKIRENRKAGREPSPGPNFRFVAFAIEAIEREKAKGGFGDWAEDPISQLATVEQPVSQPLYGIETETIHRAISKLTREQAEVIRARYPLLPGKSAHTQTALAKQWGITKQAISLREKKALATLRKVLESEAIA